MINAKMLYNTILNDQRILAVAPVVLDAYPNSVTKFPCVIFVDDSQADKEFADNEPLADTIGVQIHIFTKAVANYKTTTEIGLVVAQVMKENYFFCSSNTEAPDVDDNIRHRIMYFRRDVYSL